MQDTKTFTRFELYELNDAIHEVVNRMCDQGQTDIEIQERSLENLWGAQKKVTFLLLGETETPGIKRHEPKVLDAIANPKKLPTAKT